MIVPIFEENVWRARLDGLPRWKPPMVHTLVIAPHPDDETLGAGGLIAALRGRGVEVSVVAVTDGENAYAGVAGLGEVREREQTAALARLGVDAEHIHRLRLVDSSVTACEERLVECLLPLVEEGMHVVAPWEKDFHPDHEACGRAARSVAALRHVRLSFYFFWTWHRGRVEMLDGLGLRAFAMSEDELRAKLEALACHRSQLEREGGEPILPENLLAPARRAYEVYLPA